MFLFLAVDSGWRAEPSPLVTQPSIKVEQNARTPSQSIGPESHLVEHNNTAQRGGIIVILGHSIPFGEHEREKGRTFVKLC